MDMILHNGFTLKRLLPADWLLLKTIRLEALKTEPHVFGRSYSEEAGYTGEDWVRKLENPHAAYWGLYAGNNLVGMTGILRHEQEPVAATLITSYIQKACRGKGLSALFYEARISHARALGCRYIIVSHRAGNEASKAANQRFGFRPAHHEKRLWPDGTEADNIFYRLEL